MGLQSFSRVISLQTLKLLIYFFRFQDPPLYLALDIQHHLPVQHLVLTRPQHLDKVRVPASRTLQALAPYRLQHHCFLLVPSPHHHLLLGQCQAAANLLCLGSSLVSLHLVLGQLLIPVSCVMNDSWNLYFESGVFFFFNFETMCISYFLMF